MAKPQRARHPARRNKSGGSFVLGMFFGLVLGLAIALGVAFYLNRAQIPFLAKAKPGSPEETPLTQGGTPAAGVAQNGAPGEKPKFDFYKILPGNGEAPVTSAPVTSAPAQPATPSPAKTPAAAPAAVYYLQTGAFQNPAEADNQKAKLALAGFDSDIERVSGTNKGTLYRVRLGPYTGIDKIDQVRQQLVENGFKPSLVIAKGTGAEARH